TATSVRVRDGKRLVTDGPFAETREQLGGYFLIDAKNLDEAISIAARIPGARKGAVEIRPVLEIAGLPAHYHDLRNEELTTIAACRAAVKNCGFHLSRLGCLSCERMSLEGCAR